MAKRCEECGRDDYQNPSVTVDAVVTREGTDGLELLMIKRGKDPKEWEGMWAFPGGFVDYGEDPEDAVIRELLEETGFESTNWKFLGSYIPHSNYGAGKVHIFLATDAKKTREPEPEDLEDFQVKLLNPKIVEKAIFSGEIDSLSSIATFCLANKLSPT